MKQKGFTLVELLAVVVVLAIILVIAIPSVTALINATKLSSYNRQIDLIEESAKIYGATKKDGIITVDELLKKGFLAQDPIDSRTGEVISGKVTMTTVDGMRSYIYSEGETVADGEDLVRVTEINQYINTIGTNPITSTNIKYDFIQPWIYSYSDPGNIIKDLKFLKRAGYEGVVIQYVGSMSGGDSSINFEEVWYDTALSSYVDGDTVIYKYVLDLIMETAEDLDLQVYLGTPITEEWWDIGLVQNGTWITNTGTFVNAVIDELNTLYSASPAFAGWYWSNEMYNNDDGLELSWATLLNATIAKINTLPAKPLMVGSFISNSYPLDASATATSLDGFLSAVNFRAGDAFLLQDGFGTIDSDVSVLADMVEAYSSTINDYLIVDLDFNIIVENFRSGGDAALIDKYLKQGEISSYYADNLYSFSYTHYYNYLALEESDPKYNIEPDIDYRESVGIDTSSDTAIASIEVPPGGIIYSSNGKEAPIPSGFSVSGESSEQSIDEGLVIKDSFGNSFVWIPVNIGIKTNYHYGNLDDEKIAYTRYLGNETTVIDGTMPGDITNETHQIEKYRGFYIARYEASYDYNAGTPRLMVKESPDAKASPTFSYLSSPSEAYTDSLWNIITSAASTTFSEAMDDAYGYSANVRT